ncbi:hypothetical protein AMK19_07050 [Kitasatospora sp. CB01950]|nr:hypothetical protein AMK19_07050 [Kitasatospora sp. CB01950]
MILARIELRRRRMWVLWWSSVGVVAGHERPGAGGRVRRGTEGHDGVREPRAYYLLTIRS